MGARSGGARPRARGPYPAALAAQLQPAGSPLVVTVRSGPPALPTSIVVEGVCPGIGIQLAPDAAPAPAPAAAVATGDPAFDAAFVVRGDPLLLAAVLDAEARHLVPRVASHMKAGAVLVEGGVVTAATRVRHDMNPEAILLRGREVVALAERLVTPADPVQRLRAAARADPVPGVRLRAALALGVEGRETLLALASDAAADDATLAGAVNALGVEAPHETLLDALRRALGPRPEAGRGLPRAALAIVPVLGKVGTAAAVPTLRDCERHGGGLRRAARAAIAEIQARLPDQPGALSLTDGPAGEVSLADGGAGQVSLPPEHE